MKRDFLRFIVIIITNILALFLISCDKTEYFTVTFVSNGGTVLESIELEKGSTIPIPTIEREGYTLEGWYISLNEGNTFDEKWSFASFYVNEDIILYAKWNVNDYTITFVIEDIDRVEITKEYGSTIYFPQGLTKLGYIFDGWFLDEEISIPFEETLVPAGDLTLYAGWEELAETNLTITFHYYRYNNDYDDWGIFLWPHEPIVFEGNQYEFVNDESDWQILEISLEVTNMFYSSSIGFNIVKGNWTSIDIISERFIDLSSYESGSNIDIYVVQGIEEVFYDLEDTLQYLNLQNNNKDYFVTGQFNGWDCIESGMMTPISIFDERISSIQESLTGVKYLYIKEITLSSDDAGWAVTYKIDGTVTELNGNLTIKIVRTSFGDSDARDFWAQSPESGEVINLTPTTLYIPPFVEENIDQAGGWNDNPAALAAGTYYIVFAEFEDYLAMALILIQ